MKKIYTFQQNNNLPIGDGFSLCYFILATIGATWGLFSTIPVWWLQFFTYIIFIPYRVYMYICMNSYFLNAYEPQHFGRINGIVLLLVGITSFAAYPLNYVELSYFEGNFFWINFILTAATYLSTIFVVIIMHNRRTF